MHGSACKVLRTTCSVNANYQTLAPCTKKTPKPIKTKLCQIDYVATFYRCAKFGCDRLTGGSPTRGWNITKVCMYVSIYLSSYPFVDSSTAPQVEPLDQSLRIMARTTCFRARKCLLGVKIKNFNSLGSMSPKNRQNLTRN